MEPPGGSDRGAGLAPAGRMDYPTRDIAAPQGCGRLFLGPDSPQFAAVAVPADLADGPPPDQPQTEPRDALRPRREDAISHKVFVGNLNFQTTQNELEKVFGEVGEVQEVFIPVDRASGRPRGFAFVEFTDAEGVQQAIEKLDGKEIGGRAIRVNEAQERAPRPPMAPRGGGGSPFDPNGNIRPSKPKGSRRNLRGKKRSL